MALYAFDGTWNENEDDDVVDTNVVRFAELYTGNVTYKEGVGTRHGKVGEALGGLFGIGGRTRIEEMFAALEKNLADGDDVIDVIGFSRGAALAVHFTNEIADKGVDGKHGLPIRFLGIWDLVASFGLSFDTIINFQKINLGWKAEEVPTTVANTFHAMALDERRETFNITRLDKDRRRPDVEEVWFRGVHSDIGGGNENPLRSNIALKWMIERAVRSTLPIDTQKAKDARYSATSLDAPISENTDVARDPRRTTHPKDDRHASASATVLQPNTAHSCTVDAGRKYNWSRVRLVKDAEYRVTVAAKEQWTDKSIECGPDGWTSDQLSGAKEVFVKVMEKLRRCKGANWFELIGAHGDEDDSKKGAALVRLGDAAKGGTTFKAASDADLYLFANDLQDMYGNNSGSLEVTIERL